MPPTSRSMLRVHAWALNTEDHETLRGQYAPNAHFLRDGELMGVGLAGLRRLMEAERKKGELFEQVSELDGEPVLVEWTGPDGAKKPCGVLRFQEDGGVLTECRLDHDPNLVSRFQT